MNNNYDNSNVIECESALDKVSSDLINSSIMKKFKTSKELLLRPIPSIHTKDRNWSVLIILPDGYLQNEKKIWSEYNLLPNSHQLHFTWNLMSAFRHQMHIFNKINLSWYGNLGSDRIYYFLFTNKITRLTELVNYKHSLWYLVFRYLWRFVVFACDIG